MNTIEEYNRWLNSISGSDLFNELKSMNESQKSDSFYRDLEYIVSQTVNYNFVNNTRKELPVFKATFKEFLEKENVNVEE